VLVSWPKALVNTIMSRTAIDLDVRGTAERIANGLPAQFT
jgi:hypothetical protein